MPLFNSIYGGQGQARMSPLNPSNRLIYTDQGGRILADSANPRPIRTNRGVRNVHAEMSAEEQSRNQAGMGVGAVATPQNRQASIKVESSAKHAPRVIQTANQRRTSSRSTGTRSTGSSGRTARSPAQRAQ